MPHLFATHGIVVLFDIGGPGLTMNTIDLDAPPETMVLSDACAYLRHRYGIVVAPNTLRQTWKTQYGVKLFTLAGRSAVRTEALDQLARGLIDAARGGDA